MAFITRGAEKRIESRPCRWIGAALSAIENIAGWVAFKFDIRQVRLKRHAAVIVQFVISNALPAELRTGKAKRSRFQVGINICWPRTCPPTLIGSSVKVEIAADAGTDGLQAEKSREITAEAFSIVIVKTVRIINTCLNAISASFL